MSLIYCPECKKQVSSLAKSCPYCGYPISEKCGNKIIIKNNTGITIRFNSTDGGEWELPSHSSKTVSFNKSGRGDFSYWYKVEYNIHDRDVGNIERNEDYICKESAYFEFDKNYTVEITNYMTSRVVYHNNGGWFRAETPVDKSGRDKLYLTVTEI